MLTSVGLGLSADVCAYKHHQTKKIKRLLKLVNRITRSHKIYLQLETLTTWIVLYTLILISLFELVKKEIHKEKSNKQIWCQELIQHMNFQLKCQRVVNVLGSTIWKPKLLIIQGRSRIVMTKIKLHVYWEIISCLYSQKVTGTR